MYYWEADSPNDTEKMKVLFLPETVVKLKNLTSHTQYLVSISAFNAAGDGPRSDPRPGRTLQAGRTGSRVPPQSLLLPSLGAGVLSGGSPAWARLPWAPGRASAGSRRRWVAASQCEPCLPPPFPSPQGLQAAPLGLAHNHQGTFQALGRLPVGLANYLLSLGRALSGLGPQTPLARPRSVGGPSRQLSHASWSVGSERSPLSRSLSEGPSGLRSWVTLMGCPEGPWPGPAAPRGFAGPQGSEAGTAR